VINNSLVGVIEEAVQQERVTGVLGSLRGISGVLQDRFVDLARESQETLDLLRRTPGSALGTVRYKLQAEDYGRIVEVFRAYDVRFFCYIGGNDSMDTAHRVHLAAQELGYELSSIGVPKTVDNDLAHTDHCPGYGSAARFVALAVRDSGWDTEAMGPSSPVKVVEVMGRNAGWLTAAAALGRREAGDPPHLIYLPERPPEDEALVRDVARVVEEREHCVIALSEGAVTDTGPAEVDAFGHQMKGGAEVDAFGHQMKGGAAEYVAALLQAKLGLKVRMDKPNYLQRSFCTCMSEVDADEAYRAGRAAVRLALSGQSDVMVTLERQPGEVYHSRTGSAPLAEIANAEKLLPDAYITDSGNDVTDAFLEYALPLIGTPPPPIGRLARHPASRQARLR
jgi:6-phosphofructokinase 1